MKSLIVCVARSVTIAEVCDQLLGKGIDAEFQGERILVSWTGGLAWIEPDSAGELEREYESDEISLIEKLIGKWVGFIIDYQALEVAKVIVAAVSERRVCVVDDDDTYLGLGSGYLER
ncbi:hypothetical protein GCM10023084_82900 [Streptomyces lacrimifluminis]|uniref:Uncharacterized protein n=1 Tax=Streptomyces lacrimifluminis TaxID=1500077 RepID=A0A917PE36_9ACTN|nr:hypothetical protein [Streptomyces lacrimifluminis]GGJ72504.1 hypothetical protein GCM10012282_81650 [Streptomyces lacrimifluminis]